ncbi:hypothetical protein PS874_06120 [Pseudomonas fluorescens]|nr:hypothetical protein PS874_06120 [Pseudomonas fluorescens]
MIQPPIFILQWSIDSQVDLTYLSVRLPEYMVKSRFLILNLLFFLIIKIKCLGLVVSWATENRMNGGIGRARF